jgi:hypothetical protein
MAKADDSAATSSSAQTDGRSVWSLSRSALPYLIAAVIAAGAMAWYFFVFVPGKLEYFVGLRFRTLAVASGHVENKTQNLFRALAVVPRNKAGSQPPCESAPRAATDDQVEYVARVLPEIQIGRAMAGLPVSACGITGTVAWNDVMAQAAAASRRDFDDLILADAQGDVRWQREMVTPRIGNLSELIGADDDSAGWSPLRWRVRATMPAPKDEKKLRSSAVLKEVHLGGTPTLLLVEAVNAPGDAGPTGPKSFFIAGLISSARLKDQAMRMPMAWLVFFAVPVVILFLALPFVKLATLTTKERFGFVDVVALILATIAAVGLGAIVPFATMSTAAADKTLAAFASSIETSLKDETTQVVELANTILSRPFEGEGAVALRDCAALGSGLIVHGKEVDRQECQLWEALDQASPEIDLDVVMWVDENGEQLRKWTTKAQITGPAPHRSFDHYRDLIAQRLWTMAGSTSGNAAVAARRFTIDPLRAPTTSELGVVFAMPLSGDEATRLRASLPVSHAPQHLADADTPATFFALNVRPQSVIDAIVPPGYGFAVIAPSGKVLFHSEEGLSLEENFFEEVGDSKDVRNKAASRRLVRWSGDYHGRPHRLRMQPIASFVDCPWLLVTFQEMDPVLSALVAQQSGTLRLGTLNLLLLSLVALGFGIYCRKRRRRVRDLVPDILAPSPNARRAWCLIALALIEMVVIAVTPLPSVRGQLDWLFAILVIVPIAALLTALLPRKWRAAPPSRKRRVTIARGLATLLPWIPRRQAVRRAYGFLTAGSRFVAASELAVIFLVISALPAIGFSRIVQTVQDGRAQQRWHEAVQQQWSDRQARVRERINGRNYTKVTTELLAKGFAREASPFARSTRYSYLSIVPKPALTTASPALLSFLLHWNVLSSGDEPMAPTPVTAPPASQPELKSDVGLLPSSLASSTAEGTRSLSLISSVLGALILIGFTIAVYWARSKLLPPPLAPAPDLDAVLARVPRSGSEIVLLVGPPRARKDRAIEDAIQKLTNNPPIDRIRLLDKTIDEAFIKTAVTRVEDRIATRTPSFGAKEVAWIHVSNLEAQLVDETSRTQVLRLLERLIDSDGNPPRALAVTSSVDPIAHFRELFLEERQGIYTDLVPEVSLGRSTLLLSRFRRCYEAIGPCKGRSQRSATSWDRWWDYNPREWRETLAIELDGYRPFVQVRQELRETWKREPRVEFDELVRTVTLRTAASYELLWSSCTRSEKLVLIQLAQEGFVTAQSWDIVAPLVAKGIIVQRPVLAIFNHTFRDFLRGIERSAVIQAWERMEGHGLWVVSGRLIGSSLVAGGLFYLITQDFSVQSLLPIVSGTGLFSVPLVRNLLARMSGKADAATAA